MSMTCPPAFLCEITWRAWCSAARNRAELRRARPTGPTDVILVVVDHFEPQVGRADHGTAMTRLEEWLECYPVIAGRHRDSSGRHPRHGYYYPWDEFDSEEFARLTAHCREGWGEVEVHLHHRGDTPVSLRAKLLACVRRYSEAGHLSRWPDGRPAYGFVHGNWALDNSRQDASGDYCGVNCELDLLLETGCYADFTFPAWKHTAQPRETNCLFYGVDDPARPKSHDRGARAGAAGPGAGLLLVQGPMVPYRTRRGLAMDDGDLAVYQRFSPARLDRWIAAGIHLQGRPDRIFIKLHCHGLEDRNRGPLLEDLDALFTDAEARYNDGRQFRVHYLTSREAYNVIRAMQAGHDGPVGEQVNYLLPPAAASGAGAPELGRPGDQ